MGKDSLFGTIFNQVYSMIIIMQLGGIMEVKQIGMYLIIAGAVILALKFINAIISFILSDFLLGSAHHKGQGHRLAQRLPFCHTILEEDVQRLLRWLRFPDTGPLQIYL